MWLYKVTTGQLYHGDQLIATGYSGHGLGKNNPNMQAVPNVGPIPQGHWTLGRLEECTHCGVHAIRLLPAAETITFGRTAFYCHGEDCHFPGNCSLGCLVMDPFTRGRLAESPDRDLLVS